MKTNKCFILLLLVFCRCANDMSSGENEYNLTISPGACFPEVSDKYVYPIVPGMVEWQYDYNTENPIDKFCQLPDKVLKSISTPGLIDALIHAPLFDGFYHLSNNASALKWHEHYQNFNSAKELFQRQDAGMALVAYYKLVCYDCLVNKLVGIYGEYERMMGLEILFTVQEILDKMGHNKKKEAVTALLSNYEQYDYWLSLIPIAHIMLADKYAPIEKYSQDHTEEFQCTLEGYDYPSNPNQWDIIVSYAKDFINDKK